MSIFNRFIDRFTPVNTEEAISQQIINERFVEHFDRYNNLMRLQDDRQLLEVLIDGHKNSFQSMIVSIDFMDGSFSLDEFSPRLKNPHSLVNHTVTIRHQQDWEKLEIQAKVLEWSSEDACYFLALPEYVDYQPRRNYPRLVLTNETPLKTHINPLYGAPWYATVKDISQGGMRINVAGDLRPHLHKDKLLPKCQIILDDNMAIHARGEVRSFSYINKPYRHTEISIEFRNMSQPHQSDLKHFLDYVQVAA